MSYCTSAFRIRKYLKMRLQVLYLCNLFSILRKYEQVQALYITWQV
jgi:hypothetical protein